MSVLSSRYGCFGLELFEQFGGGWMKVLFCNVGWMKYYDGLTEDDVIKGGGASVEESGTGGEIHNFAEDHQKYYGFVMTRCSIHIEKLGANKDDEYIEGVLVIWVSKHPEGGIRVIGWYKNARVYRQWQEPISTSTRGTDGLWYNIEANVKDSVLIPLEQRIFTIPRATKNKVGIGQAQTWFADTPAAGDILEEVMKYIEEYHGLDDQIEQQDTVGEISPDKKVIVHFPEDDVFNEETYEILLKNEHYVILIDSYYEFLRMRTNEFLRKQWSFMIDGKMYTRKFEIKMLEVILEEFSIM